ncbi:MAG: SH3 domain-containing protein, partial [Anaerolineae bacterium]
MQRFWDKSRFLWVVFIFSVVSLPLLFVNQVVAQADDCGNGLPQQLTIGSVGWVIPEPPEAVNVRDAPGGNKVAQIQPTEQFTVLEGPECNQTYSWWKIESETGVLGW